MKKILSCFLCAVSVCFLLSCNFEIPKSIAIKTNAVYNYSFGSVSRNLSEYLSVDQLNESIGSSSSSDGINYSICDYNPGNNSSLQQYLMEVPLTEIPVDIGKYLSDMSFAKKIRALSFEKDIAIPSFLMDSSPLLYSALPDFNGIVKSKVSFPASSVPVVPGAVSQTLPISVSGLSFNSITFRDGYLLVQVVGTGSASVSLTFKLGASSSNPVSVSGYSSAVAKIPLNAVTISNPISLTITGTASSAGTVNITCGFDDTMAIKKITGLTLPASDDLKINVSNVIKITTGDMFKSCVVGDGHVYVKTTMPSGWSNVGTSSSISITGALTAANSDFVDNSSASMLVDKRMDLKGKTFSKGNLTVDSTVQLIVNNSTLEIPESGLISTELDYAVNSVQSVTVDVTSLKENLNSTISQSLPDGVKKAVKCMYLKSSGFEGTYSNGMPEGNDIHIKSYSDFLSLGSSSDKKTATIKANSSDSFAIRSEDSVKAIEPAVTPDIDFYYELEMPGQTVEGDNIFATFNNVEVSKSYKLKIDIDTVFDWEKVEIYTSVVENMKDEIDTGVKIGSVMDGITSVLGDDNIISKIQFAEIPLYLYAAAPELDVFNDFAFLGTMEGIVADDKKYKLIDNDRITTTKGYPAVEKDSNKVIISDLDNLPKSGKTDLSELVNGTDGNASLKIGYDFGISTNSGASYITVTKQDMEGATIGNISILGRIVIKLKLKFIEQFTMDALKLADLSDGKDLFGRDSATDISDFEKYMDVVRKLSIIYSVDNRIFRYEDGSINPSLSFVSTNPPLDERLSLGGGIFDFETEKLKSILKSEKFTPQMIITVPAGIVNVPRNGGISVHLAACMYTDGEVVIF